MIASTSITAWNTAMNTLTRSAALAVTGFAAALISTGAGAAAGFTNGLDMTFVEIPAGQFVLGSCVPGECPPRQEPDPESRTNERPAQIVTMASAFQMMSHPVTIGQFKAFLTANPDHGDQSFVQRNRLDDNHPAAVSWHDAQAFVAWLNRTRPPADRGTYRLPSEAEWEYAARAGTQTPYWWGRTAEVNRAHCNGCGSSWGERHPAPVGVFAPNPFGLHDMLGTIWEWTADCWQNGHASVPTDGSAFHSEQNCMARVLKGGTWRSSPASIRAAARLAMPPSHASSNDGFRVVRSE